VRAGEISRHRRQTRDRLRIVGPSAARKPAPALHFAACPEFSPTFPLCPMREVLMGHTARCWSADTFPSRG
jgi:hypothetical protein